MIGWNGWAEVLHYANLSAQLLVMAAIFVGSMYGLKKLFTWSIKKNTTLPSRET